MSRLRWRLAAGLFGLLMALLVSVPVAGHVVSDRVAEIWPNGDRVVADVIWPNGAFFEDTRERGGGAS